MWLLARDLSFSPRGHLHRDAYNMADFDFPRGRRSEGEKWKQEKTEIEAPDFNTFILEMTCHFLCRLYHTNLVQGDKEVHKVRNMKKGNYWGPSWRLATTSSKYSLRQCDFVKVSNMPVGGERSFG